MKVIKFIKKLFERSKDDPVFHCDVYRDKANGSCAHVDGMLCDFPSCSMLKDYREARDGAVNQGPA